MIDQDAIDAIVGPACERLGFRPVRARFFGGDDPTLQVMAERPETGQLTIDDCATLSRDLSETLDALDGTADDPLPIAYRLEVSSPGIDRPLTRPHDFADWAGHEAKIVLREKQGARRTLKGELVGLADDAVTLDDAKDGRVTVPLAAIDGAKLVLTDRLIAATRPLYPAGADDIDTNDDTEEEG